MKSSIFILKSSTATRFFPYRIFAITLRYRLINAWVKFQPRSKYGYTKLGAIFKKKTRLSLTCHGLML